MESSIFKKAAEFLHEKKNNHRWLAVFLCMAVIVALGTVAALKMTGQAMTHKEKVLNCRFTVHEHKQDCFDAEGNPVCGYADYVVHVHNDDCYDKENNLVCTLPEIEKHVHDDTCYTEERVLTCTQEESKGHVHTQECYEQRQGDLVCGMEEHEHDDLCYGEDGVLTCTLEEHTHSESCYEQEEVLICGQEEGEGGHTHGEDCYETQRVLTCGQLELHSHNKKCYKEDEDGNKILICEIPVLEEHVHNKDCFDVIELDADEVEQQLAAEAGEDPSADAAAPEDDLTTESGADASGKKIFTTEEDAADGEQADQIEKTYQDENVLIKAAYNESANIPEEAQLRAYAVTEESAPERYEQRRQETMEALGTEEVPEMVMYNIGFYVGEEEIEPAAPVTVTLQLLDENGFAEGSPVTVVHFAEEGTEILDGTNVGEDRDTTFVTNSFSGFVVASVNPGNDFGVVVGDGPGETPSGDTPSDGTRVESDLGKFVSGLTITDSKGQVIPTEGGTLYVGEKYDIKLEFSEQGAQGLQFDTSGTLTFQIPSAFKVTPQTDVSLEVTIDGKPITIGRYSIDENGKLTVTLNDAGKETLEKVTNGKLTFNMEAEAQAVEGEGSPDVHFGDAGKGFSFKITDQPVVDVEKIGRYTENKDSKSGVLDYTVKTTVEHGKLYGTTVTDVLTPPQTDAFDLHIKKTGDGKPDVKVTVKKASGEVIELEYPGDYELEEVTEPDPKNPQAKTFRVKLKEGSEYNPLEKDDELDVTYQYDVKYKEGAVGKFWGNVKNEAIVKGTMPVKDPDHPGQDMNATVDEHRFSNVEIWATPPGDGIVCKDQDYSEATHKVHYTCYTLVKKGTYQPLHIFDDMYVQYQDRKWYLKEFNKEGRVENLQVTAVDVNWPDWTDDTADAEKLKDLEALKNNENAKLLTGFDIDDVDSGSTDYDPENMDKYVSRLGGQNLYIIFGYEKGTQYSQFGEWGKWTYTKSDRLLITEYDLDMRSSGPDDKLTLNAMNPEEGKPNTLELSPDEVLKAGITNNVYLRFDGYRPGYSVFFNNNEDMNKVGKLDKEKNIIEYTVTMNATDTTVNKYFRDLYTDWYAAKDKAGGWITKKMWDASMQAVFYDKLPEGWEYVEGSLYATTDNRGNGTQEFHDLSLMKDISVGPLDGEGDIRAPLVLFRGGEPLSKFPEIFNTFGDDLVSISFTYKVKATDEWLEEHALDEEEVKIHNDAYIEDKEMEHWDAHEDVSYFPPQLTKTAEQVVDSDGRKTNKLKFSLQVNPRAKDYDPDNNYLIVTDTSKGIQIKMETIKVKDAAGKELTPLGTISKDHALQSNEWGFLPSGEEGQFKLMVPDQQALTITYEALIPKLGEAAVSNEASIDGMPRSTSGYEDTLQVDKIDATGAGNTYQMTVEKQDSADGSKKLAGAMFKLYTVRNEGHTTLEETEKIPVGGIDYSCYSEADWEFTTGENGKYTIVGWNLEPGNYYILKETKAPAGYEELEKPILFYFYGAAGDESWKEEDHPNVELAIPNGTLTVNDPPIVYSLPETGGHGLIEYIMRGLLLASAAASLIYIEHTRVERRRGRIRSSRKR